MTDWVTTRLFMTGSKEDLDRFISDCIRIVADLNDGEPTFDFDALVPMPDDVRATMETNNSKVETSGSQSAPDRHWFQWCTRNWGTKWPAFFFEGRRINQDTYDCRFGTAWRTPHPIIEALAATYTTLKGITASYDYTVGCGEVGGFIHGECYFTDVEDDSAENSDDDNVDEDGSYDESNEDDYGDEYDEYRIKGLMFRPYETWEEIEVAAIDAGAYFFDFVQNDKFSRLEYRSDIINIINQVLDERSLS